VTVIPELSHREMGLAIFDPESPVAQTLIALLEE